MGEKVWIPADEFFREVDKKMVEGSELLADPTGLERRCAYPECREPVAKLNYPKCRFCKKHSNPVDRSKAKYLEEKQERADHSKVEASAVKGPAPGVTATERCLSWNEEEEEIVNLFVDFVIKAIAKTRNFSEKQGLIKFFRFVLRIIEMQLKEAS